MTVQIERARKQSQSLNMECWGLQASSTPSAAKNTVAASVREAHSRVAWEKDLCTTAFVPGIPAMGKRFTLKIAVNKGVVHGGAMNRMDRNFI